MYIIYIYIYIYIYTYVCVCVCARARIGGGSEQSGGGHRAQTTRHFRCHGLFYPCQGKRTHLLVFWSR